MLLKWQILFFIIAPSQWPYDRNYLWRLMSNGMLQLLAGPYCVRGISSYGVGRLRFASMLTIIWVVWMERNKWIFERARGEEIEHLWDRVWNLAMLWASVSPEFRDSFCMLYCWIGKLLFFSFKCPLLSLYYFCVSMFFQMFSLVLFNIAR